MNKVDGIIKETINELEGLELFDSYEKKGYLVYFIKGNTVQPFLTEEEVIHGEFWMEQLKKSSLNNQSLVKFSTSLYDKTKIDSRDSWGEIFTYFPFISLKRNVDFGMIKGFLDPEENSENFAIYFAPRENFLSEIKSKIKDPNKNFYYFYQSDLKKESVSQNEIPLINHPFRLEMRSDWFSMDYTYFGNFRKDSKVY